MDLLERIASLEENYLKGYIEPVSQDFEEESDDIERYYIDEFAKKIMMLVFSLIFDSQDYYFFQLKREDFIPLSDWSQESVLEAIYLSLAEQNWNIYLYLADQDSLIVLEDSMACPVYSKNGSWLGNLTDLIEQEGLTFKK